MKGTAIARTFVASITLGCLALILTQENFRKQIYEWSQNFLSRRNKREEEPPNAEFAAASYKSKQVPNLDLVIEGKRYRTADSVVICEFPWNPIMWAWLMMTSRKGNFYLVSAPMSPLDQQLIAPNYGSISILDKDDAQTAFYRSTIRHLPFEEIFPDVPVSEA